MPRSISGSRGDGPATLADVPVAVVDDGDCWLVVVDGNKDDWLLRYDKAPGFDARAWAENVARICNERRSG